MSLLVAVGLATPPIAAADTCANATLRAQNNSTALPDCRAYEMVTPPYKQGFRPFAQPGMFTDDGILQFGSAGSFADNGAGVLVNTYNATRSPAGWSTTALALPGAIYTLGGTGGSDDPRWGLAVVKRRAIPGDTLGFWLRDPNGVATRVGDAEETSGQSRFFVGGSSDLSHVVYVSTAQLYEFVGTGNVGSGRAVSVDNHGQSCGDPNLNAKVSLDARVITFMSACSGAGGGGRQVWARVAGSATVAVSGSECTRGAADPGGVCNGVSDAAYAGQSADGSRVFFTTSQQLVNSDVDQTSDLYACDVPAGVPAPVGAANPCDTLTRVTGAVSGAQVTSVPAVSADGSRAYFMAAGAALASNLGVNEAAPVAGQSNLYVWRKDAAHPAGQVRFVARIDNDDLDDRVKTTPDGRYLLFFTASALVTSGPAADEDGGARDMYRYDASTQAIVRVSTSTSGSGGNGSGFDVSATNSTIPLVSSNGSTVVFDTAEGLSPADTNGVTDVYSWRDGQVSLISAGGGTSAGITPSGRDIFFGSETPVLPADGDTLRDVYTARVGGGFAAVAKAVPCTGDGCQGQRSQPPAPSGSQAPATSDGNIRLGRRSVVTLKRVTGKTRKAAARTGVLPVLVTSNSAGTLSVSARTPKEGTVRRTVRVRKAGNVKVRLKLPSAARRWLRNGRPLRVTLKVTKKGARPRSSSVLLPGASS